MRIRNSVPFRRNELRRDNRGRLLGVTTFVTAIVLILSCWVTINIAFAL